jgi:hypothetical protein
MEVVLADLGTGTLFVLARHSAAGFFLPRFPYIQNSWGVNAWQRSTYLPEIEQLKAGIFISCRRGNQSDLILSSSEVFK